MPRIREPSSVAYKERRRLWVRDALSRLNVADPDGLSTQIAILAEGAIISALVRGDPGMATAAKAAARVLLTAAGIHDPAASSLPTGHAAPRRRPRRVSRRART